MTKLIAGLMVLLLLPALAVAQGDYTADWWTVNSGGWVDSTDNYRLTSSFGQVMVGVAGSPLYFMSSGFIGEGAPSAVKVIEIESPNLPTKYQLAQNYPNPFNPTTVIEFSLPRSGEAVLDVYDVTGRRVITLVNEYLQAGFKLVNWDGRDRTGAEVASGVYFYRLRVNDFTTTKKMVLVK